MWFISSCIFMYLLNLGLCQRIVEQGKYMRQQYSTSCVMETQVDPELVDKLRKGDFSSEDFRLKNYAFCMLNKQKMLGYGGALMKERVVEMLMMEVRGKAEKAITSCSDNYDYERIDKMWTGVRCFNEWFPNALQLF